MARGGCADAAFKRLQPATQRLLAALQKIEVEHRQTVPAGMTQDSLRAQVRVLGSEGATRLAAEDDKTAGKRYGQEVRAALGDIARDRGKEAEKKRDRGFER
jgi:hypothetical protein